MLDTVTLAGKFLHPDSGTPLAGKVVFTPSATTLTSAGDDTVLTGPVTATLDADGAFTLALLATDAAGVVPTGWTWQVDEQLVGARRRTWNLSLPAALGTAQLADLAPTTPAAGVGGAAGAPVGAAGGALAGSYPNPTLAPATIAAFDPTGAASTAQTAAAADATAKVTAHTAAGDPHADRAYADTAVATHLATVDHGDQPGDQGLLAWTYDPNMAGHVTAQSSAGVAGRITLVRLILRKQITWSRIWFGLAGVDAGAALTNCYLGVYDSTGIRKGVTVDISAALSASAVAKSVDLTAPFTAAAGTYFIAMLLNGTWTTNSFTFKASGAGSSTNANLAAPNLRLSNMLTGQTSLPTSLDLTQQTTSIITTGWASQWYGVG